MIEKYTMATSGKSETNTMNKQSSPTNATPPAIDTNPGMHNAALVNALLQQQQQQQNGSPIYGNNQSGFSMPPSGQIDPQMLNILTQRMMWNRGAKYFSPTGSITSASGASTTSTSPPAVSSTTTAPITDKNRPQEVNTQSPSLSPQQSGKNSSTTNSATSSPTQQASPQSNNLHGIANIMLNPGYQYQQVHPMPPILSMHPNVMVQHQMNNQKRPRSDGPNSTQQSFSPTQHLMNQLHQQQAAAGMHAGQRFDSSILVNNQTSKIQKIEGARSQSPRGAHAAAQSSIAAAASLKAPIRQYDTGVIADCPPAHEREKGKVYIVRGHLKKWDGRRFARCCAIQNCTKLAQGPTNFCKGHGGGTRCKYSGCKKAARGGSDCCAVHGGGKRCKHVNCSKAAVGNDFCRRHGGGRRCSKAGCNSTARGPSGLCPQHGGTPLPSRSTQATLQPLRTDRPIAVKPTVDSQNDIRRASVTSLNAKKDAISSLLSMGKSVIHRQDVPEALPVPVTKATDVNPVQQEESLKLEGSTDAKQGKTEKKNTEINVQPTPMTTQ